MSGTDPAGTELATIEAQIGTPAYWRDEGMQARYRDLLSEREAGTPAPARQEVAKAAPTPPARAETWRELIARHDAENAAAAAAVDAWRATPAQARERMPAALVAAWDAEPDGFEVRLHRLQNALQAMVVDIGDAAVAQSFLADFEALPAAVKVAVQMEASAMTPGFVRQVTAAQFDKFRSLLGGKELISAWGRQAHRCVSLVFHRMERIRAGLSASDVSLFEGWLSRQPVAVQLAIAWRLGSVDG